jgi:hypothetical protein
MIIVAGICGAIAFAVLRFTHAMRVRVIAVLGVAAVIWGLGVTQYPQLLPRTTVALTNAGAPHATLEALVGVFVVALLLIAPSLALLFILKQCHVRHGEDLPSLPQRRELPAQDLRAAPASSRRHAELTVAVILTLVPTHGTVGGGARSADARARRSKPRSRPEMSKHHLDEACHAGSAAAASALEHTIKTRRPTRRFHGCDDQPIR